MTNDNNKNSVKIKTLALWMGILATVFVWGMTVQALLGNVRMNANAIKQLDDLKANKVSVQAQLDAISVRMGSIQDKIDIQLNQINGHLEKMQKSLDKLLIKDGGDG